RAAGEDLRRTNPAQGPRRVSREPKPVRTGTDRLPAVAASAADVDRSRSGLYRGARSPLDGGRDDRRPAANRTVPVGWAKRPQSPIRRHAVARAAHAVAVAMRYRSLFVFRGSDSITARQTHCCERHAGTVAGRTRPPVKQSTTFLRLAFSQAFTTGNYKAVKR